jgi:hypothetical protein
LSQTKHLQFFATLVNAGTSTNGYFGVIEHLKKCNQRASLLTTSSSAERSNISKVACFRIKDVTLKFLTAIFFSGFRVN